MKKIFVMIVTICMMAGIANAQKAYIRLGVGGGVGLKQFEGDYWSNETYTNTYDNFEIKSMGLGSGLNANLAFGYMLSNYVGLELGVNEFIGLSKKTEYTSSGNYSSLTSEYKLAGKMLQIVPAIVITPGLEKINPYARLGMIVGILPSITDKYKSTYSSNGGTLKATNTSETKVKLSGGIALGFTAACGADINLGKKLGIFGELVFNGITYAPSKGKIKEYTLDGSDKLGDLTTKEKEWTFEKKYDADESIPDGSPSKRAKASWNFSNVELNIGIKFKL